MFWAIILDKLLAVLDDATTKWFQRERQTAQLLWERLNQMGEEKGSDTERKGETEEEEGEAIFMFNRWTQRKKIIVDSAAEKYQSSEIGNDKNSFFKRE